MLRIRLRREGSRNHPFFRMVVSDSRRTPRGPVVDTLGFYNPKTEPPEVSVNLERYDQWVSEGAHPSDTVKSLVGRMRQGAGTEG